MCPTEQYAREADAVHLQPRNLRTGRRQRREVLTIPILKAERQLREGNSNSEHVCWCGEQGKAIVVKCFKMETPYDDHETAEFGPSLMKLVKLGYVQVLLNLEGVHVASGSLMGCLACLHREVVKAGGFLILFGVEPIVRNALRICCLDRTIEICENEAEAAGRLPPQASNCGTGNAWILLRAVTKPQGFSATADSTPGWLLAPSRTATKLNSCPCIVKRPAKACFPSVQRTPW